MSLLLNNLQECPPGYFRYLVPETGRRFPDPALDRSKHYLSLPDLLNDLTRHYQANGIPVPGNLAILVQDQLCRFLPPEKCRYDSPGDKPVAIRHGFTFSDVVQGTKNLISWQLKGRPKASLELMNERGAICVRCPYNANPPGCATCNSPMTALVNSFVGPSKSMYDSSLYSCMATCGCSLKALIQMPPETIAEHLTDEQREQVPEYCWQK
jgi:hypothetical protein